MMRGRRGPVILGTTEGRVAQYLANATRHGLVTLRSTQLIDELGLSRSEFYRITRQLRALGLFGIADDRSGIRGGRRYWRTPTPHDQARELDPVRHRMAWARVRAWLRARKAAILARTRRTRHGLARPQLHAAGRIPGPGGETAPGPGPTFLDRLLRGGLDPSLVPLLVDGPRRRP